MTAVPAGGAPSVRRRLTVFTLSISALLLLVTGVSLTGVNVQRRQADLLTVAFGPSIEANDAIRETMSTAQSSLRGYIIVSRTPTAEVNSASSQRDGLVTDESQGMLAIYRAAQNRMQQDLSRMDRVLATVDLSGSVANRTALLGLQGRQREAVEEWWSYARSVQSAVVLEHAELRRGDRLYEAFSTANRQLADELLRQRDHIRDALIVGGTRTGQAIAVATALALALALLAGWRTTVALTVPLRRVRDVVHRQRNGDRTAWARTDLGAAEVRGLAADVNALTAAQIALLDNQAYSLALQKAAAEIGRRVQDTMDLANAFRVVTQGIARALRADRAAAGVVGHDERLRDVVLWTPERWLGNDDVPQTVPLDIGRLTVRLWHGERKLVVPDMTAIDPQALGWSPRTVAMQPRGGVVIVSFGLTEQAIGAITVRSFEAPREWLDVEVAFVEQVAAKLARALAKAQAERDRQNYIRLLEELDEHKDAFMSTVSHELRTPLASIVGYLEMLDEGDAGELTDMQRAMLEVVGRNAVRLRGLIEDLLVLNRMDTTTLTSSVGEVVDLGALLLDTVEELLPTASKNEVSMVLPAVTPVFVLGDHAQLGRALTNVISNAVKFAPGGVVRLGCTALPGSDTVEVICSDNGIGIPAAEQSRLFNRFFRASNATTAQIPGTGLGLAIVRIIVERHGGTLELESSEGIGTTVRMVLPLAAPNTRPAAAEAPADEQVDSVASA